MIFLLLFLIFPHLTHFFPLNDFPLNRFPLPFFTTSFFLFTSFTSLSLPPFAFPFLSVPLLPFPFLTRLSNSLGRLRTPGAFTRSRPRENFPHVFWTGSFDLSQLALVTLLLLYERAQEMGLRRQRNIHRTRLWPTGRGRVPSPGTTSLGGT